MKQLSNPFDLPLSADRYHRLLAHAVRRDQRLPELVGSLLAECIDGLPDPESTDRGVPGTDTDQARPHGARGCAVRLAGPYIAELTAPFGHDYAATVLRAVAATEIDDALGRRAEAAAATAVLVSLGWTRAHGTTIVRSHLAFALAAIERAVHAQLDDPTEPVSRAGTAQQATTAAAGANSVVPLPVRDGRIGAGHGAPGGARSRLSGPMTTRRDDAVGTVGVPGSLERAGVPTAEAIHSRHDRRRVRVSLPQLRMLLELWHARTPCTTTDLNIRGLIATTVRTLRSLEHKHLVRSTTTSDPVNSHPLTVYDLTAIGHDHIRGLVTDTPPPPPHDPTQPMAAPMTHSSTATTDTPPTPPPSESLLSVSEVLDFFEKCPRCGYAATATRTIRERNGVLEHSLHPTCGLPCGWNGTVRRIHAPAPRR